MSNAQPATMAHVCKFFGLLRKLAPFGKELFERLTWLTLRQGIGNGTLTY